MAENIKINITEEKEETEKEETEKEEKDEDITLLLEEIYPSIPKQLEDKNILIKIIICDFI